MFWRFFLDFAYEIAEGGPGHLANFPLKIPKTPTLNLVDGFPLGFGGFLLICLQNFVVAFLQEGGPGHLANFP